MSRPRLAFSGLLVTIAGGFWTLLPLPALAMGLLGRPDLAFTVWLFGPALVGIGLLLVASSLAWYIADQTRTRYAAGHLAATVEHLLQEGNDRDGVANALRAAGASEAKVQDAVRLAWPRDATCPYCGTVLRGFALVSEWRAGGWYHCPGCERVLHQGAASEAMA
jgi:hypothetical protein